MCIILYNIVVKCLKLAACLEDKKLLLYCFLENMSKHKHFHWNNTQALECCPNTLSIHRTCVELYPCTPRAPRNILWVRTASGLGVRPNLGGSSRPAVLSPQRLLEVGWSWLRLVWWLVSYKSSFQKCWTPKLISVYFCMFCSVCSEPKTSRVLEPAFLKKVARLSSQLFLLDRPLWSSLPLPLFVCSRELGAADGGQLQFAADLGEHAWHGRRSSRASGQPQTYKRHQNEQIRRAKDLRIFGMTRYNNKYDNMRTVDGIVM